MTNVPAARTFTPAALRNRVRVELEAPVAEVWALLGDLPRFPEYSVGLGRVDATLDAQGRCVEYVCHFEPHEPGAPGVVSREVVRWWEPGRGYASSGAAADAFGLVNDLNLVTLEPAAAGTLVTWEEYFDAAELDMMRAHFDAALADIGENLARRFGGRIVERYVDGAVAHA